MPTFAVVLLVLACIAAAAVVAVNETRVWQKQRRQREIERLRREVAETQQRLQALAIEHKTWLEGQALEARKAMIMESFRASQGSPGQPADRR
jgi:hypothetical protein